MSAQKVKELQRSDPAFKEAWGTFCDDHNGGKRDPAKMSPGLIAKGLRICGHGAVKVEPGTARGEKRTDPADGGKYTKGEFYDQYGGYKEWDAAAPRAAPYKARSAGRGAGKVEKRVDPADGGSYTKQEFRECYGGLREWDKAGGRGRGAGRGGGSARHEKVSQDEKNLQFIKDKRKDRGFNASWKEFCDGRKKDGQKEGLYDPDRHHPKFIKMAIEELIGRGTAAAVLAPIVIQKQKGSGEFKEKWAEWCAANTDGTKDPRRLSDDQLRAALKVCDPQAAAAEQRKISLVTQVQTKQRSSPDFREAWVEWCAENNSGRNDPSRMDVAKLSTAWAKLKNTATG